MKKQGITIYGNNNPKYRWITGHAFADEITEEFKKILCLELNEEQRERFYNRVKRYVLEPVFNLFGTDNYKNPEKNRVSKTKKNAKSIREKADKLREEIIASLNLPTFTEFFLDPDIVKKFKDDEENINSEIYELKDINLSRKHDDIYDFVYGEYFKKDFTAVSRMMFLEKLLELTSKYMTVMEQTPTKDGENAPTREKIIIEYIAKFYLDTTGEKPEVRCHNTVVNGKKMKEFSRTKFIRLLWLLSKKLEEKGIEFKIPDVKTLPGYIK